MDTCVSVLSRWRREWTVVSIKTERQFVGAKRRAVAVGTVKRRDLVTVPVVIVIRTGNIDFEMKPASTPPAQEPLEGTTKATLHPNVWTMFPIAIRDPAFSILGHA